MFAEDLIEAWIGYKRSKEIDAMHFDRIRTSFFSTTTSKSERTRNGRQKRGLGWSSRIRHAADQRRE